MESSKNALENLRAIKVSKEFKEEIKEILFKHTSKKPKVTPTKATSRVLTIWKAYRKGLMLLNKKVPIIYPMYPKKAKVLYEFLKQLTNITIYVFEKHSPIRENLLLAVTVFEELLHVNFVYLLSKFFNRYSYSKTIDALKNYIDKKEKEFRFAIPRYMQTFGSCGVVCLANSIKVYNTSLPFNKKKEREWLARATLFNYPGNMPFLLKEIAEEQELEAKLFWDKEQYLKNTTKEKLKIYAGHMGMDLSLVEKVRETFVNKMKDALKVPAKEELANWVRGLIEDGYLVIFCGERSGILHYNLVFGYDEDGFIIWDPIGWERKVAYGDFPKVFYNNLSSWGLAVRDKKTAELLEEMEKHIKEMKQIISEVA